MVSDEAERKDNGGDKMNIKKLVVFIVTALLSLSMMGCPNIKNTSPEILQMVDGELQDINHVVFEHVKGTDFSVDDMVQSLIEDQHIIAIDYDQSSWAIGKTRPYKDISDQIVVSSFYQIWQEGEDANFDGAVDAADEEYYGQIKTDQDGNKIYDEAKILLVEILSEGSTLAFTINVSDDEGASTELSGEILIVAAS